MNFDVLNLDDGTRLKMLDCVLREKKVSCEDLGVSRVMMYNYRLKFSDESPPFKWEWFSEPLDYPLDERCKPESMMGTMSPLGGNSRPFQGGTEFSEK